ELKVKNRKFMTAQCSHFLQGAHVPNPDLAAAEPYSEPRVVSREGERPDGREMAFNRRDFSGAGRIGKIPQLEHPLETSSRHESSTMRNSHQHVWVRQNRVAVDVSSDFP